MLKQHLRTRMVNGEKVWELRLPSGRYILDKPKNWAPGVPLYIGEGGLACAFRFHSAGDPSKVWVIKDMKPPKDDDLAHKQALENMRLNLLRLIKNPVKGVEGIMVPPLELIDFPESGTFGYRMQFVDLSRFKSVTQIHATDVFPDAEKLCTIACNLSTFYHQLGQAEGLCYKDVNEGNIFLNPGDGSIRVIDNDNIGVSAVSTIEGTGQYRAPEIFTDKCLPDMHTDTYQLATYLLRLFTGAYPLDGRRVRDWCRSHGTTLYDRAAQEEMLGRQALFVFHPTDRSNALPDDKTDPDLPIYAEQQKHWDRLPPELTRAFTDTFTHLTVADRALRPTPQYWNTVFKRLKELLTTCPKCKKKTFGTSTVCYFCGAKLNPRATCLSCGRKTFVDNPRCVHCHRPWKDKPPAKVACPHCGFKNPGDTQICSNCKEYTFSVCLCGKKANPKTNVCSCGLGPLWQQCLNPSCGKMFPFSLSSCPFCRQKRRNVVRCSECKRILPPGTNTCPKCRIPVDPPEETGRTTRFDPPGPPVVKPDEGELRQGISEVELKLVGRIGGRRVGPVLLRYTVGDPLVISARTLDPQLSDTPLFRVKTHLKLRLPVFENLTSFTPAVYSLTLNNATNTYDRTPQPNALLPGKAQRVVPKLRIDLTGGTSLTVMSFRVVKP